MSKFHRLLKRQLKKVALPEETIAQIMPLIQQVDEAYKSFDNDLQHLENILELSSQELFDLNKELQGSVEDISRRLTKVVNNIQEVIFEIDLKGNWIYLNSAWEKLTGFDVNNCLHNKAELFLLDRDNNTRNYIQNFLSSKNNTVNHSIEIITKSGTLKNCDFSLKKMYNLRGDLQGIIGTLVDITELKEVEKQLITAREKAIKANEAKDTFLSTISHEIRNPLSAINGISQLLLLEASNSEQSNNLKALQSSTEHLMKLVNDILHLNKIEFGAVQVENSNFELSNLLEKVNGIVSKQALDKNLFFEISVADDVPHFLIGDSIKIIQILTNLIQNAIKFTDQGGVHLNITSKNQTRDSSKLLFSIQDTGIGISEEQKKKIFESFVQIKKETNVELGTGLGLTICKKLLELMGSDLILNSQVNKGSTFEFELQFNLGQSLHDDNAINISETTKDLEGLRILVAEDHELNVLVLKRFLSKWNVVFDCVENGQEAIEFGLRKEYDLILMDIQMPEVDGIEASLVIRSSSRSKNRSTPIYALTGTITDEIHEFIKQRILNGYILKPFEPSNLYLRLKEFSSAY